MSEDNLDICDLTWTKTEGKMMTKILNGVFNGYYEKDAAQGNYASEAEILEFCNEVRELGGEAPLQALMPSVPMDSTSCLIAKNVNFDLNVNPVQGHWPSRSRRWGMFTRSKDLHTYFVQQLVLEDITGEDGNGIINIDAHGVLLPERIGNSAAIFDAGLDFNFLAGASPEEDTFAGDEFDPYNEL